MDERQQYNMESVLGNKVLIQLHRQAYEMLQLQGVESERFVARVTGLDAFGLWIENPNYCTIPVFTEAGDYIEPENRTEECQRAVLLLQWPMIQTLIQFPDRPDYVGGVDEGEIGFKAHVTASASPLLIGVPVAGQDDSVPQDRQKGKKAGKGKERKRG
jgi:hypothetical protein